MVFFTSSNGILLVFLRLLPIVSGDVGAVDIRSDVQLWPCIGNPDALAATDFDEFIPAKLDAIESWKHHDVFQVVPDTGQQRVTNTT